MTHNGTTYYYVTNLQGDVTDILNSSGTAVVSYIYDAWGNIRSTTGTLSATLGKYNPLRYRGYVYDTETKFYYLQSRYYNPDVGRFLNADVFASTGQGILGNNMFAYCGNNPIVRKDPSGDIWETIFDIISIFWGIGDVIANPSDVGAWIGLGLDFVDLIPFFGGTGEAYRLYRITDKTIDGFGVLSKASDYGIMGYNSLRKVLKGTGLQAHHIIEKRLVKHLGIDIDNMLSVAVTIEEHRAFTKAWREIYQYGMDYSKITVDMLWKSAKKIYKDYPELLEAAKKILYG